MTSRARLAPLVMGIFLLMATNCNGGDNEAQAADAGGGSTTIRLPSKVLGLDVEREDVSGSLEDLESATYLENLALFSLREKDVLRATLQVGLFRPEAREDEESFRRAIVSLLRGSTPRTIRVGDSEVFMTTGPQQNFFAWFEGDRFFVLTVHQGYPFPRGLLRRLVEVETL